MTSIYEGEIISRDSDGVTVTFHSRCSACRQLCSSNQKSEIYVAKSLLASSDQNAQILNFSMALPAQIFLLLNSLLLPLAGFLFAAAIGEFFNMEEGRLVLFSIFGLLVGILLCREFPGNGLNIKEVC